MAHAIVRLFAMHNQNLRAFWAFAFALLFAVPTVSSAAGIEAITRPSEDVTLSFVTAGRIARVLVKDGDAVKAGQLLVGLDDEAERVQVEQLEISAKYQGYIDRQAEEVAKSASYENTLLPPDLDYAAVAGLSNEVRQKLQLHKPQTIGQASRIQGLTPAAISLLLIHLKRLKLAHAA